MIKNNYKLLLNMKTIIKTIICATLILLPHYGFSQATDIDVKGIIIGDAYTKAQVQAKWGTPTQYRSNMSEFGLDEVYDYSTNQFCFGDNGILNSFYINTPDFPVFTAYSGGVKVGDTLSRISTIGLGIPVLQSDGSYYLFRNGWDDPVVFKHSNGVITQISFTTSI